MSVDTSQVVFALLSVAAVWGALAIALTREIARLILGLGVFLGAVAGLFLYLEMPVLAVAQVFVYVGGVLVLVVFAIMLLRRSDEGRPELESHHRREGLAASGALFAVVVWSLWGRIPAVVMAPGAGMGRTADRLLGGLLPAFEFAGVLLLAALLAALTIVGRAEE